MADKPLIILPGEIKTPPLSKNARLETGYLLRQFQKGILLGMPESRPMPSVGAHCHELRITDAEGRKAWRIIYRIDRDAILIADVFAKKTKETPALVIEKCKRRFRRYDREAFN